ncbi:hypothetical protein KUTeg_011697 [Tegillarca granosa]|uniref:UPF3 domain-containing protein n=1 Tax=Tegillarca granosa TaxID=220873 RepID=A0ABQ9EXE2_TEGGR|nr:hypothetical protein KUTeg_011697 [Tegillarca granosa]
MTQSKSEKSSIVVDRKKEKDKPPTKVVIRRLPPSLTPETLLEQISPLPNHDFFYFVKADLSLGQNAFTRAYINFQNHEDVFIFRDKFDGYVFVDGKGNEYAAIVEFSPFQRVPKRKSKKSDAKKGTIEQDSDYQKFLDSLQNPEEENVVSIETYLEELEAKERENKGSHGSPKVTTPLIEFIKKKREEKRAVLQKIRDERRKKDQERKKQREDERKRKKEKEREKERDRQRDREKDRDGKIKDKDKEKHSKDQSVKVLKNPERDAEFDNPKEKSKEKESSKPKEEKTPSENKSKERENLRFSKENREKQREKNNERAAEKQKSAREAQSDRGEKSGKDGQGDKGDKSVRDERGDKSSKDDKTGKKDVGQIPKR